MIISKPWNKKRNKNNKKNKLQNNCQYQTEKIIQNWKLNTN